MMWQVSYFKEYDRCSTMMIWQVSYYGEVAGVLLQGIWQVFHYDGSRGSPGEVVGPKSGQSGY